MISCVFGAQQELILFQKRINHAGSINIQKGIKEGGTIGLKSDMMVHSKQQRSLNVGSVELDLIILKAKGKEITDDLLLFHTQKQTTP